LEMWVEITTAMSPEITYPRFRTQEPGFWPPSDSTEYYDRSRPHARGGRSVRDDVSRVNSRSQDSYDQGISSDHNADVQIEDTGFRRLRTGDYSSRPDPCSPADPVSRKRSTSPPPVDASRMRHCLGSAGNLYRRRESTMNAPDPRYPPLSGSVSSTSWGPGGNSYASTLSLGGSSIASMDSFGHLSPRGISPVVTDDSDSAYVPSLSSSPNPRGSLSRTNHGRALSDMRPFMTSRKPSDTVTQSKLSPGPEIQAVLLCECCPKKPKKFDSKEKLK
jgi:hypothetical protein